MDDDYDNGVVVADMSSALPERQVDYSSIHGARDDPLGTPEAQSVLHRAERVIAMSRAAVAARRATPPYAYKYAGANGSGLVPASPPGENSTSSVEAESVDVQPVFKLVPRRIMATPERASDFSETQTNDDLELKNDFRDVFHAESAPWFTRLESAHARGKKGCNGDGGRPFAQVTTMRRQLERCKAYKSSCGVVETSLRELDLPEMWVPARNQLYRRVQEERSERSMMAASDDSANGSMSVGQMDPDRSVRKSNVTLPQRSVVDTAHQKLVVATLMDMGVDGDVAAELVRTRWSEGGLKNLSTAWAQWSKHVAVLAAAGTTIDKLRPTAPELVNFLRKVRYGVYRTGDKQDVMCQASWVRGVRSAISTTVSLWVPGPALGAHPLVSGYITSIKNEDFQFRGEKGYRYDDTWDTEPLYEWLRQQGSRQGKIGVSVPRFQTKVQEARDATIPLGRLALACRSHDLTCIYRGMRSNHDTLRFHFDDDEHACPLMTSRKGLVAKGGEPEPAQGKPAGSFGVTGVSIRYYGPKQRHSMAVRSHGYTDWITVDAVEDQQICFASNLYWYFRASEMMFSASGVEGDKLFCSSTTDKRHGNKYWQLSSTSLANRMKAAMAAAGIPLEFKSHSARHAGIAAGKKAGMTDEELMARSNMSAPTYIKFYSRQVRRAVYMPSKTDVFEYKTATETSLLEDIVEADSEESVQVDTAYDIWG